VGEVAWRRELEKEGRGNVTGGGIVYLESSGCGAFGYIAVPVHLQCAKLEFVDVFLGEVVGCGSHCCDYAR